MKKVLFVLLIAFISMSANAQIVGQVMREAARSAKPFTGTPILTKGSQVLHGGIGFPNKIDNLFDLGGIGVLFTEKNSKSGPFYISYEYMLRNNLGLGITLQHASAKRVYTLPIDILGTNVINAELQNFGILGSISQHLYTTDKLDTYLKGSLGVNIWNGGYKTETGTEFKKMTLPTPVAYHALAGLRYFVSPQVGPYIEVSYGNLLNITVNGGIALKLK